MNSIPTYLGNTELFEKRNGSIILKPAIYERLTPYINGSSA